MIGFYLFKKCQQKLEENLALIKEAWAHPENLISFEATGALAEAAKGGMSGLAAFAEDYVENNAAEIGMAILKATGNDKALMEAFNMAMNMLAMAIMIRNNLVFRMLQDCAETCMDELAEKDKQLKAVAEKTKELYAALASLVGTPDVWKDTYANMRLALKLIYSTRDDLKMVASTYSKNSLWLSKKFDGTVTNLEKARDLLTPKKNNPAIQKISEGTYKINQSLGMSRRQRDRVKNMSDEERAAEKEKRDAQYKQGKEDMKTGLGFFGTGLADNFPFPTNRQQWQAMLAIGKLSNQLVNLMQGYYEQTSKCNALIAAFKAGLGAISLEVPTLFKKMILGLLEKTYQKVDLLARDMSFALNGSEWATAPIKVKSNTIQLPSKNNANGTQVAKYEVYKPNNLEVTIKAFKWIMDINLILKSYQLIPSKQLNNLNLSQELINKYQSCVKKLLKMDNRTSGLSRLNMKDAEEITLDLDNQMIAFLLEANNAVIGANVRKEILAVGRSILGRLELSLVADKDIYEVMEEWANVRLPDLAALDQIFAGLKKFLQNAGLDRAADLLATGDYKRLFKLNAREASYVGAALAALAMLKNCFKTDEQRKKAEEMFQDLKSDSDLISIRFSINFDLSIFKNLLDCIKLNDLANMFSLQELLCGIMNDIISSGKNPDETKKKYQNLANLFTF